jgi:hypothetical protein
VTAFLHFLALRDHQAETPDERPDKRPSTPEDDALPPSTPSRAEILGTFLFSVWERGTMSANNHKLPFLHRFCFETTSTLLHLSLYWERRGSCCYSCGNREVSRLPPPVLYIPYTNH